MNPISCTSATFLLLTTVASAQWKNIAPVTFPGPRAAAGMATDPNTGNVILYGGDNGGFSPSTSTWSYNGNAWTQLTPTGAPGGKVGIELVYDVARGVFVMYGSLNTSFFGGASVDQTWEFNGGAWTQVFPVTTPGGLGNYGACYDTARSRVVIYGGTADSFFPIAESGTWEFDGTNWSAVATVGSPGPLERPAMCYHAGIGRTVLFGGIDPQTGGVDTTWLYNGTNWTAAPVTSAKPAARTGAKLAYDSVRGVCVLTGGSDPTTGAVIVDTWEFDGAGWTQVPSVTIGRFMPMLAFVPSRRQMVLYGGVDFSTFTYFSDTQEYGARVRSFGTGCAGSNGTPALSAVDAPRLGANYSLNLTNLNPSVNVAVLVLGLNEVPATPLGGIGMTGCSAYITPDLLLTLTATAGSAPWTLGLPSTLSLMGVKLFAQGLSVDPLVNPAWLTNSNAVEGVLGR